MQTNRPRPFDPEANASAIVPELLVSILCRNRPLIFSNLLRKYRRKSSKTPVVPNFPVGSKTTSSRDSCSSAKRRPAPRLVSTSAALPIVSSSFSAALRTRSALMNNGLGPTDPATLNSSSTRGLHESSPPSSTRVLNASDSIWKPASSMTPIASRRFSDKQTPRQSHHCSMMTGLFCYPRQSLSINRQFRYVLRYLAHPFQRYTLLPLIV